MDGTIADLYGQKGWLEAIYNEDADVYECAEPLYNMDELNHLLYRLKMLGWEIAIVSWLAKGSSKSYDKAVRQAKKNWLKKVGFPTDYIHIVKYGATKANSTRKLGGYQVLIDDNEQIRKGWTLGGVINALEDIIPELKKLERNL